MGGVILNTLVYIKNVLYFILIIRYATYTKTNFTLEKVDLDTPFILKGFAKDLLDKFDYDYIMQNFNDDKYDFQFGAKDQDQDNTTVTNEGFKNVTTVPQFFFFFRS